MLSLVRPYPILLMNDAAAVLRSGADRRRHLLSNLGGTARSSARRITQAYRCGKVLGERAQGFRRQIKRVGCTGALSAIPTPCSPIIWHS